MFKFNGCVWVYVIFNVVRGIGVFIGFYDKNVYECWLRWVVVVDYILII